jgi:hypothetical protein
LTDQSVVTGLLNLGSLLTIDNGSIGLNSSALGALNVSANLTFYNVSVYTGFNKSLLNTSNVSSFLSVDGAACTAPRCTNMNYSNTSDTFNVTVSQWSTYAIDVTPPTISSPGPTGTQSGSSVTLTATTNEDASCKYSTTDQGYSSMSLTMDGAGGTSHTKSLSLSASTSYTYYVRCRDGVNNTMSSSTSITFTTGSSSSGSSGGGGGGAVTTTGNSLSYTPATVTLSHSRYLPFHHYWIGV